MFTYLQPVDALFGHHAARGAGEAVPTRGQVDVTERGSRVLRLEPRASLLLIQFHVVAGVTWVRYASHRCGDRTEVS